MSIMSRLKAALLGTSILLATLSPQAEIVSHATAATTKTAMESAVRATLPNGLRVVIVPDRLAPVVQTQVIYLAGSTSTPENFPGTAHALEHMMFNGSKGLSRDQLSTVSARIGDNNNAFTTEDTTQYYFQAPAQNLGLLLHIEADRMRGALLTETDWDHERGAIEQEVSRDLSMPFERYMIRQNKALFGGTPYEHNALGTLPSFDKTDATVLRRFYDSWYQPNNAILLIVGDVDPQQTLAQVRSEFGSIPAGKVPSRPVINLKPVTAQTINEDSDLAEGVLTLGYRMPGARDPDYATAQILADALGSQRGALFELVPQGKALATEFQYSAHAHVGSGNAVAAYPKGQDPKAVLTAVQNVMAQIRTHGVPAELVEAAKRKEIAELEFDANSITDLAQSWAGALALNGVSSPADLVQAFRDVTPAKVNALAAKVLDPAHTVTGILTPTDTGKPTSSEGKGPEHLLTPPTTAIALPGWAQKEITTLNLPPAAPQPAAFTLPNGLRVLVQPEHVSHTVRLYGSIRHQNDLEEPKGKEGVAGLTNELFLFGSTTRDRLALATALDDLAADANGGTSFSLSALSPNFDKALALLADNELHPAFPAQAFSVLQHQSVAARGGILQSPAYRFQRAGLKALNPPTDPTLRETTPQSLAHLTLQDVRDFYAKAYRPDLTTIVIIGDITPEHARQAIETQFGPWKAQGPAPIVDLPPRPLSKESHSVVSDPGRLQDSVYLLETVGSGVRNADRYALEVGNQLLGTGFSSRLLQDLRVRTGMVYSAGSALEWSRNRGAFLVVFGADPNKVNVARKAAERDVQDMRDKPAASEELAIAKASLLRAMPMSRASFDALAGQYLELINLGLPLNEPDERAKAIYGMTPEAVQAAYQKWIRPGDLAQVVRGPAPI
ncbi:M16 family metallopeptidase [Kozakia baliensis]|uniref:M16 family metallopeptidase n=1 Tax=Kozakia baliensis TaxID=153496 RepID=UPI0004955E4D|nr:pitrilysin family protein [Kozakia baliensis]